jgi:hypothetical protein
VSWDTENHNWTVVYTQEGSDELHDVYDKDTEERIVFDRELDAHAYILNLASLQQREDKDEWKDI